jgi:hypothetical protein
MQTLQVTTEKIDQFRQNGHVIIEALLTQKEVQQMRTCILKAIEARNIPILNMEDRDTYGKAFLQIMNLWETDVDVAAYVLHPRLAQIAAQLLGVDNVRIYHDQALFKEPGGGPTPWHQDQYYWPIDTAHTVTMWMPLVDIEENMGMLTFASQSHLDGLVFNTEISDDSDMLYEDYVLTKGYPISREKTMKAGDATWHFGHTIHQAPGNYSNKMREVMTIIFVADGARVTQPKNKFQENDLKTWIPDTAPGELVASRLNPLIL